MKNGPSALPRARRPQCGADAGERACDLALPDGLRELVPADFVPAYKVRAVDTAAVGDAFNSAFFIVRVSRLSCFRVFFLLLLLDISAPAVAQTPPQSVIGQGGVVYDAPLRRYIFASWSCATHELYESPHPWGPWRHFLSNDFGPLFLSHNRGEYGTSIPSKFISSDGKTLSLQSNLCCDGDSYTFSLRKLYLETYAASSPANTPSSTNLATSPGTRAISKSTHFGLLCATNCSSQLIRGDLNISEDDYDEESKTLDWWGYIWPRSYNMNQVVFQAGATSATGGWYASNLKVQVRRNFVWNDVSGVTVTPAYPYNNQAGHSTYTFNFPVTAGDGIRIAGTPGGTSYFTSTTQLAVYDKLPKTPDYTRESRYPDKVTEQLQTLLSECHR